MPHYCGPHYPPCLRQATLPAAKAWSLRYTRQVALGKFYQEPNQTNRESKIWLPIPLAVLRNQSLIGKIGSTFRLTEVTEGWNRLPDSPPTSPSLHVVPQLDFIGGRLPTCVAPPQSLPARPPPQSPPTQRERVAPPHPRIAGRPGTPSPTPVCRPARLHLQDPAGLAPPQLIAMR